MEKSKSKYEELKERINEIIENFSFEHDPLEPPTDKQEDLIRAMVVLCHAEFEDYIEQLANKLLEDGKAKWLSEGVANKNIAALFMNTEKMKPGTKDQPMTTQSFAIKTITNFENQVSNGNHGIKAKNIDAIYSPLGYPTDFFDQNFLNELDSFGLERGKIAHTSSARTKNTLDFNTEREKIIRVLEGIEEFENSL